VPSGTSFRHQCNTCSCSKEGNDYFVSCTELFCGDSSTDDLPDNITDTNPSLPRNDFCKAGIYNAEIGSSYPSTDGCNRCTCNEFGFACTEMACGNQPEPQGCKAGVVVIPEGKKILDSDACNTCTCQKYNGRYALACTEMACIHE
jgi:hypothetical protein